jgi:hypothetical protein
MGTGYGIVERREQRAKAALSSILISIVSVL